MTQPEALRLADLLERRGYSTLTTGTRLVDCEIAAELRRLHAVVQAREDECETHSAAVYEATRLLAEAREQRDELLEALEEAKLHIWLGDEKGVAANIKCHQTIAAIAKAEGKT